MKSRTKTATGINYRSTNINRLATELLHDVKRALKGKNKPALQVHLEVSGPEQSRATDAARLMFYYQPCIKPGTSNQYFTSIDEVDLTLRVNVAERRVENQCFIKLLSHRLGLSPFFSPAVEHRTSHGHSRTCAHSFPFTYNKLLAALRQIAQIPLVEPLNVSAKNQQNSRRALRQKLLAQFGISIADAYAENFPEIELTLQAIINQSGQLKYTLAIPGSSISFLITKAIYSHLTLCDSWDEDDYGDNYLSRLSAARFQKGALYTISLGEVLYALE